MKLDVIHRPSPHFSGRFNWKPDMICCHQTGGSIGSCVNWFQNPKSRVSSHFAVAKDGKIYQFVDLRNMAWCNGTNVTDQTASNHYSKSPNSLIRERKANANLYTVSVEFENDDTGKLTDAQYCAGVRLMFYIVAELKRLYNVDFVADREHLIGHCDCSPINKANCPGKDFPFGDFLDCLNARREALERVLDLLVTARRKQVAL